MEGLVEGDGCRPEKYDIGDIVAMSFEIRTKPAFEVMRFTSKLLAKQFNSFEDFTELLERESQMTPIAYIYRLLSNERTFYVGETRSVMKRHSRHRQIFGDCEMEVIECCPSDQRKDREHYWMEYYTNLGFELKNKRWQSNPKY